MHRAKNTVCLSTDYKLDSKAGPFPHYPALSWRASLLWPPQAAPSNSQQLFQLPGNQKNLSAPWRPGSREVGRTQTPIYGQDGATRRHGLFQPQANLMFLESITPFQSCALPRESTNPCFQTSSCSFSISLGSSGLGQASACYSSHTPLTPEAQNLHGHLKSDFAPDCQLYIHYCPDASTRHLGLLKPLPRTRCIPPPQAPASGASHQPKP